MHTRAFAAAALVLLVVAGLMLQSAACLAAVDPGFRTEGVLTFGVVLPMAPYREASDRVRFANAVTERLRSLPGVRQAAMGAYAPMGDMRATRRYAVDDKPLPAPGRERNRSRRCIRPTPKPRGASPASSSSSMAILARALGRSNVSLRKSIRSDPRATSKRRARWCTARPIGSER